MQLAFGETISLDMYRVFYQLLSTGVVWLGILLLIFTSLLPDLVFMLIGRQFYPSETQKVQVTMKRACFVCRCRPERATIPDLSPKTQHGLCASQGVSFLFFSVLSVIIVSVFAYEA